MGFYEYARVYCFVNIDLSILVERQLVLFKSFRLNDFSFPSNKSGYKKICMAHRKHMGLDFVSYSMVNCKG